LDSDPAAKNNEFIVLKDEDVLGIITPVAG
jgi:co-chaperonin GroES (HSP10)